jgi:hypothetical protein
VINFIVYIDVGFNQALTGGVVAMHQLAKVLAEKEQKVSMIVRPEYPHPNIYQTTMSEIQSYSDELKRNTVVIYPQIVPNNPTNIPNVVRWALYNTDNETEKTYGESDVIFNFGNFRTNRVDSEKRLTVFNYYFNIFQNQKQKRKRKFCHLLHKHTPDFGLEILKELNSEDLGFWKSLGCQDYLFERFNDHEYFLTYDQKSFFPLSAGLCGTKTIILNPDKNLTPTEYRLQNPIQMFGVAYGWEDLAWAEQTIHLVPDYLRELEKLDKKTVDSFISFWYDKLK